MKKNIFQILVKTLLILLLMYNYSYAQNTFLKTYGGAGTNQGFSLIQTADSGYALFGYTDGYKISLIKTNKSGDSLWTKVYGSGEIYLSYSLTNTPDGGYLLGFGNKLIKTDDLGNIQWNKSYDRTTIFSVDKTFDGGYVFTGYKDITNDFNLKVFLMKVDNSGDSLWMNTLGIKSFVTPKSLQATSDSGYVITGYISTQKTSGVDLIVIKTDKKGDTLWTKTYGYDRQDSGNKITETKDGNYFITGEYTLQPCEYCDLLLHTWLLKLDQNGDTLWTKKMNLGRWELSSTGKPTKDGGYVITGSTNTHLFMVKTTEFGDTVWTKTFIDTGIYRSEGHDIIQTNDDGYAITGSIMYYNDQTDIILLKLDKDGNITAIDNKNETIPVEFSLQQNYPNPFNPETTINYTLPESGIIQLKIFDVLGRELKTLVNEFSGSGLHSVKWDGSSYSSGVYFCSITFKGKTLNNKMLLMK